MNISAILRISTWGFLVVLCLATFPAYAVQPGGGAVAAAPRDHTNTPLVIIRFNQRHVYFQRPLYTAVSRALEVKPSARFTMVSVVPTHGGERKYRAAETNFSKVVQYMREMGIPQSRITVNRRSSNAVKTGEVHVYVK